MTRTHDERFHSTGFHGCPSVCRLRVYEEDGNAPVILVTELEDNPGTSITNMAEQLATTVWKMLEKPALGLVWIEHFEDRVCAGGNAIFTEHFDRVTFEQRVDANGIQTGFSSPRWQRLCAEDVEALLSQPIAEALQLA